MKRSPLVVIGSIVGVVGALALYAASASSQPGSLGAGLKPNATAIVTPASTSVGANSTQTISLPRSGMDSEGPDGPTIRISNSATNGIGVSNGKTATAVGPTAIND